MAAEGASHRLHLGDQRAGSHTRFEAGCGWVNVPVVAGAPGGRAPKGMGVAPDPVWVARASRVALHRRVPCQSFQRSWWRMRRRARVRGAAASQLHGLAAEKRALTGGHGRQGQCGRGPVSAPCGVVVLRDRTTFTGGQSCQSLADGGTYGNWTRPLPRHAGHRLNLRLCGMILAIHRNPDGNWRMRTPVPSQCAHGGSAGPSTRQSLGRCAARARLVGTGVLDQVGAWRVRVV